MLFRCLSIRYARGNTCHVHVRDAPFHWIDHVGSQLHVRSTPPSLRRACVFLVPRTTPQSITKQPKRYRPALGGSTPCASLLRSATRPFHLFHAPSCAVASRCFPTRASHPPSPTRRVAGRSKLTRCFVRKPRGGVVPPEFRRGGVAAPPCDADGGDWRRNTRRWWLHGTGWDTRGARKKIVTPKDGPTRWKKPNRASERRGKRCRPKPEGLDRCLNRSS